MSPLRLLDLVADVAPGVEASLVALAPALASRGMRIVALCAGPGPMTAALRARGVRVHVGLSGDTLAWNAVTAATALAEETGADLIRAFPGSHALGAIVSALAARPCVAVPESPHLNMREVEAFRLVDRQHLAVTTDAAALHARAVGLPADRVHVVPAAVDLRAVAPQRHVLRERLGVAPDAPVIGYVGRLVHDARPWQLIRAALPAMARDPALALVLAGEGSLQPALEGQARRAGIAGRVHFLHAPSDALLTATSVDVLVLPGRALADEHAALCALYANLPLVADARGPLAGTMPPAARAMFVDTQHADALADALASLLANPAVRAGAHAPEQIERTHAVDVVADRLAALYTRLAAPAHLAATAGERVTAIASR